jgi:hypothetical protein
MNKWAGGGGAGGDLVMTTGVFAPTNIIYTAGGTTVANTDGANGTLTLS